MNNVEIIGNLQLLIVGLASGVHAIYAINHRHRTSLAVSIRHIIQLTLSIVAVLLGIIWLVQGKSVGSFDGFVLIVMGGLLLLVMIPFCIGEIKNQDTPVFRNYILLFAALFAIVVGILQLL